MIYLNNAATTYPKPDCVREALDACVQAPPPSQYRGAADFRKEDVFVACRRSLGQLLGIADTDRIFFTSGATQAMNTVIAGLPLDGRLVLTTQTEHNSVLRPLMNLPGFAGHNRVVIAPCGKSGRIDPDALEACITKKTGALIVNHCSNVTGMVQDMPVIASVAKKHSLYLVVDVSQSAGCLPVDADAWGADALIFTGHKSLFGVQGTGGFYIRRPVALRPLLFGGTGRNSAQLVYHEGDFEYEAGTQNAPGIAALLAGVDYVRQIGIPAIAARERRLMRRLYDGLARVKPAVVYGSYDQNMGPVLSFNIQGLAPSDVAFILHSSYGILVRTGLHCAPLIHKCLGTAGAGTVRVSLSYLTPENDIDTFIRAVYEIGRSVGVSN